VFLSRAHFDATMADVVARLERIEQRSISQGVQAMSALSDLQAQVAANTSVEASAVTLIQGLAAQIATAAAASDTAALQALSSQLNSSASALAAAITANTPAAPPAPAPTSPAPVAPATSTPAST
jgi:hypothetical protein